MTVNIEELKAHPIAVLGAGAVATSSALAFETPTARTAVSKRTEATPKARLSE